MMSYQLGNLSPNSVQFERLSLLSLAFFFLTLFQHSILSYSLTPVKSFLFFFYLEKLTPLLSFFPLLSSPFFPPFSHIVNFLKFFLLFHNHPSWLHVCRSLLSFNKNLTNMILLILPATEKSHSCHFSQKYWNTY